MTEPLDRGSSVVLKQHFGEIVAGEIVPDEALTDKLRWFATCRFSDPSGERGEHLCNQFRNDSRSIGRNTNRATITGV